MYEHITRDDRVVISDGLRCGESYTEIGERIGKDRSTVWREVTRNSKENGIYDVRRAHKRARERRSHSKEKTRKIENDPVLKKRIERMLHPLVSPEVVAHAVGLHHQTIYDWIYRTRVDLKALLPQRGKKRRRYGSHREMKQGWTKDARSIHERREEEENWEGDTIKGSTKARILTHVERTSLFTRADLMPDGTADSVQGTIKKKPLAGTITYDRGSEFALWRLIEKDTGATIYFADARAPWQRGKNENTNGRLRRIYSKKFDFGTITQRDVDQTVWKMNHTPRPSLFWQTPCRLYGKCCGSG